MTRAIPGVLDTAALAALSGREQHKPTDANAIAREARRLHAQGLTHRDIAEALGLSELAVATLLRGAP
jgi:DNA-binding transcriptional regulator LsrR (DeoR family)